MPPVVRGCPFNTNLIFLVYADNDMPLARLGKPQNTPECQSKQFNRHGIPEERNKHCRGVDPA
jgi:hypothetical protein